MFNKLLQFSDIKKLFLILLIPAFTFAYNPLSIDFSRTKKSQADGSITIKMTNYSKEDIKVLKWNTPLEKNLNANIFSITIDNKPVQYTGRMVKRGKASEDDYILFKAGEQRSITLDLPQYYMMTKAATYKIEYSGTFKYKRKNNEKIYSTKILKSALPSIEIYFSPNQKKTLFLQKLPANFNGCSQSEITDINNAHDEAILIAKDASDVMDTANSNTAGERYYTWFGIPNTSRQNTVKTHFNNIYSALDTQAISFDCVECSTTLPNNYNSTYAYVYPSQTYTIYLCGAFWSANVSGTDSKSGTIVHETSHFTVLAGTNDHAYGKNDAQSLAISNPDNAVDNADNHEYFAENIPFLSMDNVFNNAVEIPDIINNLPLTEDIAISGEKDLYVFTAPTSGQYTFGTVGNLDTIGTLYNSSYVQLIENDDTSSTERNFSFNYILSAGQRYYLAVRAYGSGVGGYTLQSSVLKTVSDFVERFYVNILNRPSDSVGLEFWVNQLMSGTKAGTDIAKGFINSVEFSNRNLSDEAYVTVLYQAFFNRAPDSEGFNLWISKLASGVSRDSVLDGFLGSQEFKNLADEYGIKVVLTPVEQFVTRFYEQCLLRSPDASGFSSWSTQLDNGTKSGADIARGFIFSEEFVNRGLNNADYLNVLYRAFFAREADAGGFNSWLNKLNSGVSREDVLNGFLDAQEFSNLASAYNIRVN